MASLSACHLLNDNPPEAPPQVEPASSEPAPPQAEPAPPPEEPAPTPAPPPEPKPVEPGIAPTGGTPARGTLPKAVIDEKLKSAGPGIQACYENALKTKPELRGDVNVDFVVAPDGKIARAAASESDNALDDAATVDCILAEIRKLEFPTPKGGRVFINYPLHLEPPKPGAP